VKRRRKLLLASSLALLLTASLLPVCDPPPLATGPYLQAVTQTGVVVCCWTASPAARGLRIRQGERLVAEVPAGDPTTHHELRAGGLAPGTEHGYELVDAEGQVVERGRFRTRSADDRRPLRFAIFGDSGGQPSWIDLQRAPLLRLSGADRWLPIEDEPQAVARVLAAIDPEFCLHTGDVIYPSGEHTHYATGLYRPFGALMRAVPIYPVFGNHDYKTADGQPFLEHFALPEDGGAGERNFTFSDGPVRFVGLDLNTEVGGPDHPALAFLKRIAAASSEPWLVVWSHYPVQSAYRDRPRQDLEQHYLPLCRELGVDLLCAGHDHNYQRFGEPGETVQVVTGGGGKSLYEIRHRPDGLVAAEVAYHACEVLVDGPTLRLTARSIDGAVLDAFTIDKAQLLREGRVRGSEARLARLRALVD
jgi:predicted phosphodiesterase